MFDGMGERPSGNPKERAENLFRKIDINGDGGISKEEFLTVGKKLFNYGEEEEEEDNP